MSIIDLSWWELALAALLVLALAATSHFARLGMARSLLVAAARTVVQLALVGLVLEVVFELGRLLWIALMSVVMLLVAGREVMARQKYRLTGGWAFGIGTLSMFISAFTVTVLTLTVIIGPEPWYMPQYSIPILGMLLGNTMTGVALGLDRLTEGVRRQRALIENRLMLGQPWHCGGRRDSARRRAFGADPGGQRDGRRRHRQPAGHDDRPDPVRHAAGGRGQVPDPDHVRDCRWHRFRHARRGQRRRPPTVRRA